MFRLLLLCALLFACSESSADDESTTSNGGSSAAAGAAGDGGESGSGAEAGAGGEPDLGPPPAGDTCDDAVDVNDVAETDSDGTLLIRGTNVAARDDLTACDTLSTPLADVVYSYTVPKTGALRWTLSNVTPTLFVVDLRTSCDDVDSGLVCDECGIACGDTLEVTAGDTLYFVVFGVRTTNTPDGMGLFDLTLDLTPDPGLGEACVSPYVTGRPCPEGSVCQGAISETPTCGERVCGDGLLSFDPLECDDGNEVSGDGCSAECMLDAQGPGGASCDAPALLNLPRMRGILSDTTLPYGVGQGTFVAGSELDSGCSSAAGPEAVYVFELSEPGHVEIAAENTEVLSLRLAGDSDCGSEEIECLTGPAADPLTLEVDLQAGRYALILDREDPSEATTDEYTVTVVVTPQQ